MIPSDMQELVERLRAFVQSVECECDSYHGHRCNRCILLGEVERLSARTIPEGDELDLIRQGLARAYENGCLTTHENYQEDRDPEFTEAALDYADDAMPTILAALQPHILSAVEAERERAAMIVHKEVRNDTVCQRIMRRIRRGDAIRADGIKVSS